MQAQPTIKSPQDAVIVLKVLRVSPKVIYEQTGVTPATQNSIRNGHVRPNSKEKDQRLVDYAESMLDKLYEAEITKILYLFEDERCIK